ncbi:hypothetical protein HQ447_20245 [bacterium]|nr:hypothetical protein [bacterium]
MKAGGDKLVTNEKGGNQPVPAKKGRKVGPLTSVKFGSSAVPIDLSEANARTRYLLCHYRDGKRMR